MQRLAVWLMTLAMMTALGAGPSNAKDILRVAAQYGLGYAPLFIMAKNPDFLKKYAPDAEIKMVQLAGGAAIREALLSDTADIGGLAMLPVIQAWAKGTGLKIALALSDMPVELMTWRPDLKSVKDFKPDDKVNVVSIGSPQTLIMKMAALKNFGSSNALDSHFVAMAHPDAAAALIAKRGIAAHFATPPYIRMLKKEPGMHVLLSNKDFAAADFTFIVAAAGKNFAEGNPKLYAATISALKDVIVWMNQKPEEAATFLAANQAGKLTKEDWLAEMKQPGVRFSPVPHGLAELSKFMTNLKMTAKAGSFDDLTWSNLHGRGGS